MEFTEKQLERLVEDVKGQLSQLLKGEAEEKKEVLVKSEPTAPAPIKAEEKPLEKAEESSSEAKKAEESSSDLEKSGLPPAKKAEESSTAEKAEESSSKTEDSAKKAEESSSTEDMEKAYKEMSKSERETHYKALKRFIWEDQGFEIKKACKEEEKEESSTDAKKAEESSSTEVVEKAEAPILSKAEEELATVKSENETLKKSVEQLIASLEKVIVKGPDRKSVASVGEVIMPPTGAVVETVTEPVLKARLTDLSRSDKLTKAERDQINDYCLFGKGREDVLSIVKEKSK